MRGIDTKTRAGIMAFLAAGLLALAQPAPVQALSKNGFAMDGALLPVAEIVSGGPLRDGIPAIDAPAFIAASAARGLADGDRVLGILRHGFARAYPVRILNWHEIVNDRFGDEHIVVSYCPLCGTGIAFLADGALAPRTFGVSGLLYNSDVLLYDRETESLWSQIMMQAISGPLKGTPLTPVPLSHTTWQDWRARHPGTVVLSTDTGFHRDYDRDPYLGYASTRRLLFPVAARDRRYHEKERVLGVAIAGTFKAYPFSELAKTDGDVTDTVATESLRIRFDRQHQSATAFDMHGKELPAVTAYWFAWYAFHPETEVFQQEP